MSGKEGLSDGEVERWMRVIEANYGKVPDSRGVPAVEFVVRGEALFGQEMGNAAPLGADGSENEADLRQLWMNRLKELAVPVASIALLLVVLVGWETISSERGKAPPGAGDPTSFLSPPPETSPPPLTLPPDLPTE